MDNPYSSPQAFDQSLSPVTGVRHYGGIRRLPYLGIAFGLGITQNVVLTAMASNESLQALVLVVLLLFLVISFVPVYYRLQNIGMNPWWCLLMLVPIANLVVGIRCLICQEGYADTKKLDTAGKIVTFIILGLFLLVLVAVILAFALRA
jgi:uncharacterized membrane protein YhaH (DUF805 family)